MPLRVSLCVSRDNLGSCFPWPVDRRARQELQTAAVLRGAAAKTGRGVVPPRRPHAREHGGARAPFGTRVVVGPPAGSSCPIHISVVAFNYYCQRYSQYLIVAIEHLRLNVYYFRLAAPYLPLAMYNPPLEAPRGFLLAFFCPRRHAEPMDPLRRLHPEDKVDSDRRPPCSAPRDPAGGLDIEGPAAPYANG